MGSLYEKRWFCVSTRAWSMSVRASAVRPDMAQAMWESISSTFSMLEGSCREEVRKVNLFLLLNIISYIIQNKEEL